MYENHFVLHYPSFQINFYMIACEILADHSEIVHMFPHVSKKKNTPDYNFLAPWQRNFSNADLSAVVVVVVSVVAVNFKEWNLRNTSVTCFLFWH